MARKGAPPKDGRTLLFANQVDGLLYPFGIREFVVLQTMRSLARRGVDPDDITSDMVNSEAEVIARALMVDGWFTQDEYAGALASREAEDIDEEWEELEGWI